MFGVVEKTKQNYFEECRKLSWLMDYTDLLTMFKITVVSQRQEANNYAQWFNVLNTGMNSFMEASSL